MKYNENSLIERSEDRRIRLERWDKDERDLRERGEMLERGRLDVIRDVFDENRLYQ